MTSKSLYKVAPSNLGLEKGLERMLRTLFPLMHKPGELFIFECPYGVREDSTRFLHRNQEAWVCTIEIEKLVKENRDRYVANLNVDLNELASRSKDRSGANFGYGDYGSSSITWVEKGDTIMYLGYEIYRDNHHNLSGDYEYRYITWWFLGEKVIRGYIPNNIVVKAYGEPGTWKQPF